MADLSAALSRQEEAQRDHGQRVRRRQGQPRLDQRPTSVDPQGQGGQEARRHQGHPAEARRWPSCAPTSSGASRPRSSRSSTRTCTQSDARKVYQDRSSATSISSKRQLAAREDRRWSSTVAKRRRPTRERPRQRDLRACNSLLEQRTCSPQNQTQATLGQGERALQESRSSTTRSKRASRPRRLTTSPARSRRSPPPRPSAARTRPTR